MKSFKEGIKSGEIKRADAMKVLLEDIHEEPGFNLRREGEDLDASIAALAAHIVDGGMIPPLEVRPREDGGVWIVDGHRRARALAKVADQLRDPDGKLWVSVVAFNGNDADRVARIITSAEGRALSQLEVADGYKRLRAFNWTPDQIARKVGKTRQHVDQLLILADANSDVQARVAAGEVAATVAIDTVRKHGANAGEVLARAVMKVKSEGRKKVTAGTVKGKPLPRKLADELVDTAGAFVRGLSKDVHQTLATMKLSDTSDRPTVTVDAAQLFELVAVMDAIGEAKEKQADRGRAKDGAAAQGVLA